MDYEGVFYRHNCCCSSCKSDGAGDFDRAGPGQFLRHTLERPRTGVSGVLRGYHDAQEISGGPGGRLLRTARRDSGQLGADPGVRYDYRYLSDSA